MEERSLERLRVGLRFTRRAVVAGSTLVFCDWPLLAIGADSDKAPTSVLFVCQFGSVKSAVAREAFRHIVAESDLSVIARSRALTPADHLSPELKSLLFRDGVDPTNEPLRRLSQADLDEADIVVVFSRLPEGFNARRVLDWTDAPALSEDYEIARNDLFDRLRSLAQEIEKERASPLQCPIGQRTRCQ